MADSFIAGLAIALWPGLRRTLDETGAFRPNGAARRRSNGPSTAPLLEYLGITAAAYSLAGAAVLWAVAVVLMIFLPTACSTTRSTSSAQQAFGGR
jgi:hypothetical protein